jgi:glucose-1-phosphatase
MRIKAVIWDLGGVLVRTEDGSSREALAKRLGLTRQDLEHAVFFTQSGIDAQAGRISEEQHWKNVCQSLGLSPAELDGFIEDFFAGDQLDLSLINLIRELRKSYKIGLLSNHLPGLRTALQNWKVEDVFDAIIISAEVKMLKPDESIYHMALNSLRVSPGEAVFIDDYPPNLVGAQKVGIYTLHFKDTGQVRTELFTLLDGVNL